MLSDLELDRGRREAKVDDVVSYSELEKAAQGIRKQKPAYAKVVAEFLKKLGATTGSDARRFCPGSCARSEEGERSCSAREGSILARARNQDRAGDQCSRRGSAHRGGGHGARARYSEGCDHSKGWKTFLEPEDSDCRDFADGNGDRGCAGRRGSPRRHNRWCGELACDPHERGSGPLFANQLIILDIFPRDARSGYFGDLTRTVVRGTANEAQRRLWETCLTGQERAFQALKPGASGSEIHEDVKAFFAGSGYPTEIKDGRWQGFFHGTGHGLGLEIHEEPRFAAATFRPGQVFTVEPGIYWPGVGGVRHEDVVVITAKGHRPISNFPKQLET